MNKLIAATLTKIVRTFILGNPNQSSAKTRLGSAIKVQLLIVLMGFVGSPMALATTWNVPGDYATIQAALADTANVVSDDVISVGAGIFTEVGQIVIDRNLSIEGVSQADTIIRTNQNTTSSGDTRGWILVNAGITLNLSKLTIDGTGFKVFQGIRTRGNGTIQNVTFTNIQFDPSGPNYAGTAIAAFGAPAQNVNVFDSTFTQIGRLGVLYFGAGITDSTFSGNTYAGKGIGDWLDFALDIGAGANVLVEGNTISNNLGVASVDGSPSNAILVTTFFGAGTTATIKGNTISNNARGIAVGILNSDSSTVTATNNAIFDNTVSGVVSTNPTVNATQNWWGSSSGPADSTSADGSTPDTNAGSGNAAVGPINYSNWLFEDPATATCFFVSKLKNGKTVVFPLGCG